jgi:hypothetical protein
MADLAHLGPEAGAITVDTKANPSATGLLAARGAIERSSLLKDIFRWSKEEHWGRDRLIEAVLPIMAETLDTHEGDVQQATEYLADEYSQIGDAILIIDRETGRAVTRVTEEDIWQPAPVPREGGGMAKPLPRLRPEVEGFLVRWQFDRERDKRIHAEMLARSTQTPMLREMGDRRLLPVTAGGRRSVFNHIREMLPETLGLGLVQGTAKEFLDRFDVRQDEPTTTYKVQSAIRCAGVARARVPISDPTTFNLSFDRVRHLQAAIGLGWVAEIAHEVSTLAHTGSFSPVDVRTLQPGDVDPALLWVAGADDAKALRAVSPEASCLICDVLPVGVGAKAGAIVVDPLSFRCEEREVYDRWEIIATFEFAVHLDPEKVRALPLSGVTRTASVT